jgi:hypothetical protein
VKINEIHGNPEYPRSGVLGAFPTVNGGVNIVPSTYGQIVMPRVRTAVSNTLVSMSAHERSP